MPDGRVGIGVLGEGDTDRVLLRELLRAGLLPACLHIPAPEGSRQGKDALAEAAAALARGRRHAIVVHDMDEDGDEARKTFGKRLLELNPGLREAEWGWALPETGGGITLVLAGIGPVTRWPRSSG